jgi:NADH-quinone oxidoreductase subunit J
LDAELAFPAGSKPFYYVFSAIAIGAAARVITHTRPVYAALWFVMVVLSSAGLFLTLAAEFMAFALIIIYAGAILVTYMFVIMLASQTTAEQGEEASPLYDRYAREPLLAAFAGFLLLAAILTVTVSPTQLQRNDQAQAFSDKRLAERVLADRPSLTAADEPTPATLPSGSEQLASAIGETQQLANIERVGLDLFRSHPLGLELAGVILLVSLIGAVVIAKTRVAEEQPRQGGPGTVDEDAHRFG